MTSTYIKLCYTSIVHLLSIKKSSHRCEIVPRGGKYFPLYHRLILCYMKLIGMKIRLKKLKKLK